MNGNFAAAAAGADCGLDFEPQFGFLESSEPRSAATELAVTIDSVSEMMAGKTHSGLAGTGEEIGWDVSPSPVDRVKQMTPLFEIYQVVGPTLQSPASAASRV